MIHKHGLNENHNPIRYLYRNKSSIRKSRNLTNWICTILTKSCSGISWYNYTNQNIQNVFARLHFNQFILYTISMSWLYFSQITLWPQWQLQPSLNQLMYATHCAITSAHHQMNFCKNWNGALIITEMGMRKNMVSDKEYIGVTITCQSLVYHNAFCNSFFL